jgi:hypothetical protein
MPHLQYAALVARAAQLHETEGEEEMMSGSLVGTPYRYRGSEVQVRRYQPDYLAYVDGNQVGSFWISAEAADKAARRHIDAVLEERARA